MKQIKKTLFLQQNTITREHLARSMRRYTNLNISKASEIVDDIIESLSNAILDNKQIKVRLFGIFSIKQKNARTGRNPKTMVETPIPARRIVRFKIAPTLKKRINDNIENIGGVK